MQVQNFSKIRSKIFEKYFFENIASFPCRECQTLSLDMRNIFFTANNEGRVGFFLLGLQTDRQTDLHFF